MPITNSVIRGMEEFEVGIVEDVNNFEEGVKTYNLLKEKANLNYISQESGLLEQQIQDKISNYNTIKSKINGCLDSMVTYREFIGLIKERILLIEEFDFKIALYMNQYDSEDYTDALYTIDELKQVNTKLKINAVEMSKIGISSISKDVLNSYGELNKALDEFKKYIEYLKEEKYSLAEEQYLIFSKSYTLAYNHEGSISDMVDEVDDWYHDSIGICLKLT